MAQFMWGKANILIPDRGRAEAKSSQEVAQCLGERERLGAFRVVKEGKPGSYNFDWSFPNHMIDYDRSP